MEIELPPKLSNSRTARLKLDGMLRIEMYEGRSDTTTTNNQPKEVDLMLKESPSSNEQPGAV
eukprot:scaffold131148_cov40-Cyclotella_meneghiniana.AAC.3